MHEEITLHQACGWKGISRITRSLIFNLRNLPKSLPVYFEECRFITWLPINLNISLSLDLVILNYKRLIYRTTCIKWDELLLSQMSKLISLHLICSIFSTIVCLDDKEILYKDFETILIFLFVGELNRIIFFPFVK